MNLSYILRLLQIFLQGQIMLDSLVVIYNKFLLIEHCLCSLAIKKKEREEEREHILCNFVLIWTAIEK